MREFEVYVALWNPRIPNARAEGTPGLSSVIPALDSQGQVAP